MQTQEKEMSRTKTDLYCLEQEEQRLEESLLAGKAKLDSILKLLKTSQDEIDQVTNTTMYPLHIYQVVFTRCRLGHSRFTCELRLGLHRYPSDASNFFFLLNQCRISIPLIITVKHNVIIKKNNK